MSDTEYRLGLIREILGRLPRSRFESVVDYGCADGSILRSVVNEVQAKRGKGIDLRARESQGESITLNRGNFLNMQVNEQYDLVISNQVFEHIYEPWLPQYFHVLKAGCAQGGVILMSTPNRWRPRNIIRVLTFRSPYMMQANKNVPPEEFLGHHRECSYRELKSILMDYFQPPGWKVKILRTVPRLIDSQARWVANILVYFSLWPLWRLTVRSASQDHYVVIEHHPTD